MRKTKDFSFKNTNIKNDKIKEIIENYLKNYYKNIDVNGKEISLISLAIQHGYISGANEILKVLKGKSIC